MVHIVSRAVVKVSVGSPAGTRVARILRRGDVVPEGVEASALSSLEERGLIERLPDPEEVAAAERAEAEQAEAQRVEAERKAAEQAEADRLAAEKAAAETVKQTRTATK